MKTRDRIRAFFEENPTASFREAKAALGIKSHSSLHDAIHTPTRKQLIRDCVQLRQALELVDRYLSGQPVSRNVVVASVTAALAATDHPRVKRKN